jgi:hypothetical protein
MWRSGICAAVLVLAGLSAAPGASAAGRPRCAPPVEVSAIRVIRVERNGVLVLHDGRAANVEGILLPRGRRDHAPSFFAHRAVAALAELTRGHEVTLAARRPKEDRYGRLRAQVFVRQTNGEPWLQVAMLRRGLARVNIAPDRRECADELHAAEREARAAHTGIWASAVYAIRTPETLAGDRGTFQIVEGTVKSADVRGGRAYLNFGADWRTDFTATISPADMKRFRASQIDPRRLAGMRVRVRGWIESLNGPEIEIADPEQIEILGPAVTPMPSPASGALQEKRPR